jgi:F0F1-type ATP synthase membrane subunit c/vacuolar-type H+-ATPase subunit K
LGVQLRGRPLPESSSKRTFDFRSAGFWIGFFETLVIFCFVNAGEYSAIAIIIGAKEFVRKDQIKANPAFYLLGTLVNVGIAVLFAAIAVKLSAHY